MRIDPPLRRARPEPYLPLINIVFLLLIFFLIAARLAPAAPLPVSPPRAEGRPTTGEIALYVAADGRLAHGAAVGDGALQALADTLAQACPAPCTTPPELSLHIDAQTPARRLAQVMQQLGAAGWSQVQLVTDAP